MGSIASYDELENGVRNNISPLDPEEFRRQGHMIIDFLSDYYHDIEKYPVLSQVEPGYLAKRLPTTAPYVAESVEAILQDVQQHIIPGITHWQSPNYFAYFPSSSSVAGFLGEMLSSGFNVVVDYKDWQITLSRRFRAMKLWLVLRSYGVANLRNFLRGHVRMAKRFEELVANDTGHIYMTHARVDGIYMIRFAIGASLTEDKHVTMAWKVVQETVDAMLNAL
ncbi:hypothetical protein V6N12_006336 [Hibiscus sabdariffa]|uniref:Tyrosine decarboxylase n=1 Tax=Hibiscus sabdariffa TaxID=183260 RepID=A0ABR2EYJ7_9ROSI